MGYRPSGLKCCKFSHPINVEISTPYFFTFRNRLKFLCETFDFTRKTPLNSVFSCKYTFLRQMKVCCGTIGAETARLCDKKPTKNQQKVQVRQNRARRNQQKSSSIVGILYAIPDAVGIKGKKRGLHMQHSYF